MTLWSFKSPGISASGLSRRSNQSSLLNGDLKAEDMPPPVWVCDPQGSIQFDHLTMDTDAIRLSSPNPGTDGTCVASSPFLNLSITGGNSGYIAANWKIKTRTVANNPMGVSCLILSHESNINIIIHVAIA